MKVIYVAGRFSAPDQWQRARNVRAAESLAFAVAEAGAMPLNPLNNTHNFFGTLTDAFWYEGTLELMRRCDAVILVPGWEGSKGVAAELAEARRRGLPVFERIEQLKKWLKVREEAPSIPAQSPENGTVGDSTVQGASSAHLSSGAPPSDSLLPKETT